MNAYRFVTFIYEDAFCAIWSKLLFHDMQSFFTFFQIIVGDGEIDRQMICCGYFCVIWDIIYSKICNIAWNENYGTVSAIGRGYP